MRVNYEVNFNGYICVLRGVLVLFQNEKFNFTLFGFYIAVVMQTGWDKRHRNYRKILPDDNIIAINFNCSSTTVYRNKKKLIKLGLLVEENGYIMVPNMFAFEKNFIRSFAKLPGAITESLFTKTDDEIAEMNENFTKTQSNQDQIQVQSFNSPFKEDLDVPFDDIDRDNT